MIEFGTYVSIFQCIIFSVLMVAQYITIHDKAVLLDTYYGKTTERSSVSWNKSKINNDGINNIAQLSQYGKTEIRNMALPAPLFLAGALPGLIYYSWIDLDV
jgi:hypothetical protein